MVSYICTRKYRGGGALPIKHECLICTIRYITLGDVRLKSDTYNDPESIGFCQKLPSEMGFILTQHRLTNVSM